MPMQQMFLGLGAAPSVEHTVSDGDTNLDVSTIFGSDFAANVNKILIISSGHEIGGTGTGGNRAITVPSGMGGSLDIQNAGTISGSAGAGGSGGAGQNTYPSSAAQSGGSGAAGGSAIYVASANVTVTNTGTIRGGGGGGNGGSGGGSGYGGVSFRAHNTAIWCDSGDGGDGGAGGNGQGYGTSATNGASGGGGYQPDAGAGPGRSPYYSPGSAHWNTVSPYCLAGGGGGAYSGQWVSGSSGGTGGNGGAYATAGNAGGAAGKYIELAGGISLANTPSGTLQGTAP